MSLRIISVMRLVLLMGLMFYSSDSISADSKIEIKRLDPRINKLLPKNINIEKIAGGFDWVEGPVWVKEGQYLLFSDIPSNSIFKWKEGEGISLFLKPSGYTGKAPFEGKEPGSNGLALDSDGRLVLCEHGDRRVSRLEKDGTKTTLADSYNGKRLNSPNDAVFRSNGDLYFTDPPFGLPKTFDDPQKELKFQGVYRLSTEGNLTLVAKDIKAPNGIAFSPDEKTLYITDVNPAKQAWLAYEVKEDGSLVNRKLFFDATPFTKNKKGGPDGLKVDKNGNLFAAGPEGIYIFSSDGILLGIVELGVPTSNVTWGDDGTVLYITSSTAVYRIKLTTTGAGY